MHRPHWDETRMCYEYYNVRPLYHAFLHIRFGIVVLSIRLLLLLSCVWHQENRCDGLAYTIELINHRFIVNWGLKPIVRTGGR